MVQGPWWQRTIHPSRTVGPYCLTCSGVGVRSPRQLSGISERSTTTEYPSPRRHQPSRHVPLIPLSFGRESPWSGHTPVFPSDAGWSGSSAAAGRGATPAHTKAATMTRQATARTRHRRLLNPLHIPTPRTTKDSTPTKTHDWSWGGAQQPHPNTIRKTTRTRPRQSTGSSWA